MPGPNNALTDVPGIKVGHFNKTTDGALTGTTVILAEEGAVGGVDVRGSAPGTRETDLLDPINQVEKAHAVMLTGGSAFGLDAAAGVMRYLDERNIGFPVGGGHVIPIVPGAVLYDPGRGGVWGPSTRPNADFGYAAAMNAKTGPVEQGNVGAGTGAYSGGGLKGGLGTASVVLQDGTVVAALVAINSVGTTVNPATGDFYARYLGLGNEFAFLKPRPLAGAVATDLSTVVGTDAELTARNTTLGVIATSAILTKSQAKKIAEMAQDGFARAMRPAHTMFDGDTIFTLGTGKTKALDNVGVTNVGSAAADAMARAIVHAMIEAKTVGTRKSYCDTYVGACVR